MIACDGVPISTHILKRMQKKIGFAVPSHITVQLPLACVCIWFCCKLIRLLWESQTPSARSQSCRHPEKADLGGD